MIFQNIINLDLLLVGLSIAAIGFLGFVIFFHNTKSITNRTFLGFTLLAILWGFFNYSYQQPQLDYLALWFLRLHAFFAIWYVFGIFQVLYVFPKGKINFPRWYKLILIPYVSFVSILTLTPLVFERISKFAPDNRIAEVVNGPGIFLFALTVIGLIFTSPFLPRRKSTKASETEKRQISLVLTGTLLTFSLHFIFNMIL